MSNLDPEGAEIRGDEEGKIIFHNTSSEGEDGGESEIIFHNTSSESEDGGESEIVFHNTSFESKAESLDPEPVNVTVRGDGEADIVSHNTSSESEGESARLPKEKQMAEAEHSVVPEDCVQWNFSCPTISDEIPTGLYLRPCLGGEITSPSRFYVNLPESWNRLEGFMNHLQENFLAMCKLPDVKRNWTPDLISLIPGQYVMAHYQDEWHRGQIVRISPSRNRSPQVRFLVKMIDYGTEVYLSKNEIKYMLQEYLTDFPVQGVECQLKFNRDIPQDFKWNDEAIAHFTQLLVNKVLLVTFHERITRFSPEFKRNYSVWSVSVHVEGPDEFLCDPPVEGPKLAKGKKKKRKKASPREIDIFQQFLKYFPRL